jgi:hypothetical protein
MYTSEDADGPRPSSPASIDREIEQTCEASCPHNSPTAPMKLQQGTHKSGE